METQFPLLDLVKAAGPFGAGMAIGLWLYIRADNERKELANRWQEVAETLTRILDKGQHPKGR